MASTPEVLSKMPRKSGVSYPVLVPNERGLNDLIELLDAHKGSSLPLTDEIAIFTAATESFTKKNTNVSIAESLDRLATVTQKALSRGLRVRGYISVVAGCPYEGRVDPASVGEISAKLFQMGCYEVSLGDTVGVGNPTSMLNVLNECARYNAVDLHAAHCHDTFGTGLANVLAMVNAGVRIVDSAVGGLGGCPYSPGASGNIDTESVIFALHSEGYNTGMDLLKAAEAGEWITQAVGKPNASRAGKALLAQQRLNSSSSSSKKANGSGSQQGGRRYASTSTKSSQSRRQASTSTFSQPGSPPPPPPMMSSDVKVLRSESIPDLEIAMLPTSLSVLCPSRGIPEPFEVDHTWLRDVCPEVGSSVQAGTGQKLTGTTDVPIAVAGRGLLDEQRPPRLEQRQDGQLQLVLTYSVDAPVLNAFSTTFSPQPAQPPQEPHVSHVPLELILAHASEEQYREHHMDPAGAARPWDASGLTSFPSPSPPPGGARTADVSPKPLDIAAAQARPARVDWASIIDGAPQATQGRWSLASGLVEDGLAFVTGLPTAVKGGEMSPGPNSPELARLADLLGEIRHTFYGPLWNVRSLPSAVSKNIAYTNVDLGLHMDLLYFQNPPRFQFLHMLRNQVKGGASIFTDAYKIAERMWEEDREAWHLLTQVPVAYHYQNDGRYYRYTHPVFELPDPSSGHAGPPFVASKSSMPRLTAVNYSPPFQAPLPLAGHPLLRDLATRTRFYRAFQRFADLTLSPEFRYERQLSEGECVLFDNRRVLHSRKGFEFLDDGTGVAEEEDKVKRWLKGCYVDGDAIWSSYRVLKGQVMGAGSKSNSN